MNLIFLPGWSFKAKIWRRQGDYFSRLGFKVILCELENLEECLKNVSLSKSVFIAWSLGWFRMADILSGRESPLAVVGVSAGVKFKKPLIRLIRRQFEKGPDKLLTDFNTWLFSEAEKKTVNFATWNDAVLKNRLADKKKMRADLLYLANVDLSQQLAGFNTPTLLIAGKDDAICPLDEALELSRVLPNAKTEIMHTSHLPFLTKEAEFNRLLEAFLRGL